MSTGTPPLRPAIKMTVNPPAGDGTPQTLSPVSGTNTPSTAASFAHQQGHGHSPRGSISGLGVTGAGFPRTMTSGTNSSVGGEGKYRRKVGFETFDAQPESLFTYTCQVSAPIFGWSIHGLLESPDAGEQRAQNLQRGQRAKCPRRQLISAPPQRLNARLNAVVIGTGHR